MATVVSGGGGSSLVLKLGLGLIGVAMATTLILPRRQTPAVINAFTGLITGSLKQAMGGGL